MKPAYEYAIQYPANLVEGRKYPVIFALHGKGSNEKNMLSLAEPLSDAFIVIAIRGDLRLGMGYQYYELVGIGNPIRETFDEAVEKLEAFINYATQQYPIDADKRYLLGFSQGAILSMTLALTMGDQLKGIVALNGYVPDFVKTEYALQNVKDTAVFISHGQYDSVFPIAIGQETAAYFQDLTENFTFKIYPSDHGVMIENQRDFVSWLEQDAGIGVDNNKEGNT